MRPHRRPPLGQPPRPHRPLALFCWPLRGLYPTILQLRRQWLLTLHCPPWSQRATFSLTSLFLSHLPSLSSAHSLLHSQTSSRRANFATVLANPKEFKNFVVDDGIIFRREGASKVLCIPNIIIDGNRAREIVISHAHSILAHLGSRKTLNYCEACHLCKISKPNNQKPYGLLQPLPVPKRPWEGIGMDFVGPLPESVWLIWCRQNKIIERITLPKLSSTMCTSCMVFLS